MVLFIRVDVVKLRKDLLQKIWHFVGVVVAVILFVPIHVVVPVLQWIRALVQVDSILPGAGGAEKLKTSGIVGLPTSQQH